jgi:hypothetical protein
MGEGAVRAGQLTDQESGAVRKLLRPWFLLWMVLVAFGALYVVYSQTMAFVWDEGFHLVAAQLIAWGKTPYIDFIFPQTLLNAYFNAAVIRTIAHNWHAVHVFDALFVTATICLTATYVMRCFPEPRWRLACAVGAACFVGLDTVVIPFGPVSQAYGSGMLLCIAAFRLAVFCVDRSSLWPAFLAGLLAGAAAGSTLLTTPLIPVVLVWILMVNRAGSRPGKFVLYLIGTVLAFVPELWLLVQAPRQTFFNVAQYQALFRRDNWGDVNSHDLDVFTDWTTSAPSLLLGLLTLIGVFYIARRSNWPRTLRQEFDLAAWITLSLGIFIATAHPTFGRYFMFLIPFMAILGSVGFYYAASRLFDAEHPTWPFATLIFVLVSSAVKYVFDDRDATNWHDYEKIAAKIKHVTPHGSEYLADEVVYFILRETPPSGLEFSYSHKLELPRKEEALYHVISKKELQEQVAKGRFQTFETCKDEIVDDFKLNDYFPHQQEFDDCTVFWRKEPSSK